MRTGFLTRVLGDQPLEDVASWASQAGFDELEVDVARHMGGVSGIGSGMEAVRRHGVDVCALTCFGFLLDSDPAAMKRTRESVTATVIAAAESGGGLVVTFTGRDAGSSDEGNYRDMADFLVSLAGVAAQGGVKMALKNWPGPRKDFVAMTPAGWAKSFEMVCHPNVGLNFDPSHLVWQGIDHERAFEAVADRVFLAHAKDTEVFDESLQQVGYYGLDWWAYRRGYRLATVA